MKVYMGRHKKDNIPRKIEVRIDNYDLWSLDETLAQIIHPALVKMKEQKHGTPYTSNDDVPEELANSDDYCPIRWEWILDEMIWSFSQELIDWEDQFWVGEHDYDFEGLTIKEGPNHTAVYDWKGSKQHAERMKNGKILFAKYYNSLWD